MAEAEVVAVSGRKVESSHSKGPEAERGKVEVRLISDLDHLREAVEVIKAVWGKSGGGLLPAELLRAYAHAGDPVLAAFQVDSGRMIGICVGFLAAPELGDLHLHSHMTGVMPGTQHRGVGFALKTAQRDWCLEREIDEIRWTVDPLLAANAWFNIVKLGGTAHSYFPFFYGAMDDEINRGEETDRLELTWRVSSDRVVAALSGRSPNGSPSAPRLTVPIPADYHALRRDDPAAAGKFRTEVRDRLTQAFEAGLEISGFTREDGYLLTPRA